MSQLAGMSRLAGMRQLAGMELNSDNKFAALIN
jgi:hypothetical protein